MRWVEASNYSCWVAADDGVWWDVSRNNRTRSDCATLANGPPRQDSNSATDPAVWIDGDLSSQIGASGAESSFRINRERRSVDINIGSNVAPITNLDLASIENRTVLSNGDILADADIVTVIAVEGGFNNDIVADSTDWGDW